MVDRKKTVVNNLFWRFLERSGAQGVTFVVSLFLARRLGPEIYGTVAIVSVFITLMQVFIDGGLGNALIQKKDSDDLDFSSVFYFNIIMCSLLYAIMFFISPLIAQFYKTPELTAIVRVQSLVLVVSGVKNIQQAYVSKNMMFKKFFFSTIGGTVGAGVVGLIMAFNGYGVWALVAQELFNVTVGTLILWCTVKWRPKLMFSFTRLKGLLSYGWKIFVAKFIDVLYNDIRQLIIGKLYSKQDLAYYNKAKQFPHLIVTNVNTSIDSVLLPTMAREQDDREKVKNMTRRAIKVSTYIMMPLMVGLAICAEPLINFLLGSKWLHCVLFLRIFCITYAFRPVQTANLNAIKAMGKSGIFLILEIIKKSVGVVLLLSTMWISVEALAYSLLASSLISQIINSWPNKKLLGYSYLDQLKDMLPQIALSAIMGGIVYCVTFLPLPDLLVLGIQVVSGGIIYIFGSIIFKIDSFNYILGIIKSYFFKKKGKDNK